jgi:hypothetical protein
MFVSTEADISNFKTIICQAFDFHGEEFRDRTANQYVDATILAFVISKQFTSRIRCDLEESAVSQKQEPAACLTYLHATVADVVRHNVRAISDLDLADCAPFPEPRRKKV